MERDSDSGAVMMLVLHGISKLVEKSPECKEAFDALGGVKEVEQLMYTPYHEVYKLASEILSRHYDYE